MSKADPFAVLVSTLLGTPPTPPPARAGKVYTAKPEGRDMRRESYARAAALAGKLWPGWRGWRP